MTSSMAELCDLLHDLGFAAAKTEHDQDEILFAASQLCGLRRMPSLDIVREHFSRDSGNWALPGAEPEPEEPLTPVEPDLIVGVAGEIGAIDVECSRGDVIITTPVTVAAFLYLHSMLDAMMEPHESLTLTLIGEVNDEIWRHAHDLEPLLYHASFYELRVLTVICATSELSETTIRSSMRSLVAADPSGYSVPIEVSVIDNRN